jgi:hypothetical protein
MKEGVLVGCMGGVCVMSRLLRMGRVCGLLRGGVKWCVKWESRTCV